MANVYSVVHQCVTQLQSETCDRDTLMRQLSLLQQLQWCKCAALCMTAMAHLMFGDRVEAERLMRDPAGHSVQIGWQPSQIKNKKYDNRYQYTNKN